MTPTARRTGRGDVIVPGLRITGTVRTMRWQLFVVLALAGCPTSSPPDCITVDTACAPLYAPTFDNVYTMTLQPDCGASRGSCHSATGHKGGMSFETADAAYQALVTDGRVTPGDPGCSLMIVRTSSPGETYQMPPGSPLIEAERCALIQWVASGAPR